MHTLTDGQHRRSDFDGDTSAPLLPTWRYWVGALVAYPLAVVAPGTMALEGRQPWLLWPVVLGVLAITTAALLQERHVETMPAGWRAIWVAVGLVLGSVAAGVLVVAAFVIAFTVACSQGCSD